MNLIEYIYLHASNGSRKLMGTFSWRTCCYREKSDIEKDGLDQMESYQDDI